ncbi:hypothetical protein HY486_04440 [Candidatus Woesearchaeota archaeon]|nr:hypothetical protein [Candidatus Woesearchaeota archaeon]
MNFDIGFFGLFDSPYCYENISISVDGDDFSACLSEREKIVIEKFWHKLKAERKDKVFSVQGGLGCLWYANNVLKFRPCDFKTYYAVTSSYACSLDERLSVNTYNSMRVGAVGVALKFGNQILACRRSPNVTHVRGMIDCSAAGLVMNDNGMDFKASAYQKLMAELGLEQDAVEIKGVTTIHTSRAPDFSGMVGFLAEAKVGFDSLKIKSDGGFYLVDIDNLPAFIVDHYCDKKDMNGDGAAVLLGCLARDSMISTIKWMEDLGKSFKFVRLDRSGYTERPVFEAS